MKPTSYIAEILSQSSVLQHALAVLDLTPLQPLRESIARGQVERIVLTGMGASLYGAYPAWLALVQAGLPAYLLDAAELVHYASALVTPKTLLWVISQSGRSAELVHTLNLARYPNQSCCWRSPTILPALWLSLPRWSCPSTHRLS